MTQKTLAAQIAEMKNDLAALDKLMQAEIDAKFAQPIKERKLTKFLCTYDDGTEQWFVPEVSAPVSNPASTPNLDPFGRKVTVVNGKHNNWALRIKHGPRPGLQVEIDGEQYDSMAEASRQLNLHPCTVAKRVHSSAYTTWNVV